MKFSNYINKKIGSTFSYQDKRNNHENWMMIDKHLGENNSVLDVACDTGYYALKAAEKGHFVIGFDILKDSLKKAAGRAKSRNIKNVCFLEMALSPSNVLLLPHFDTILCLSVFQHFFRLYNEERAIQMVIDLLKISRKQLFLQIPSKIGKYGEGFSVNFNCKKELIDQYIRNIFSDIKQCEVKYIGKKREKPPTENFRYLYLIEKK